MGMYKFDAKKAKEKIVNDIREWFNINGNDSVAVLGVSGGKDSTIVAALCVEALGKDRVFGVLIPNGIQNDIQDSYEVCEHLGIKYKLIDIRDAFSSIIDQVGNVDGRTRDNLGNVSDQTKNNLPPRLRMAALYAVSQSMNGRVVGTSNLSEYMIGWCTRWGDMCADYEPIINYTCTEVIEIGKILDLPEYLVVKTPSDGLVGVSDEEKFGFTYRELDYYIRMGIEPDEIKLRKMFKMNENSNFKRNPIASSEAYKDFSNFFVLPF